MTDEMFRTFAQKGAAVRLATIQAEIAALERWLAQAPPAPPRSPSRRRQTRNGHWTQRPENAVKLANARLRAVLTRRRNAKST